MKARRTRAEKGVATKEEAPSWGLPVTSKMCSPFSTGESSRLVQIAEVGLEGGVGRNRGASRGDRSRRRAHGRTRSGRRGSARAVGSRGERLLREDGVRVVHEVLEELLVLAAEVLAGLLEAVDLVQLVLLLGKRLANDLAGLLVGLVADALCVIARVCHELVGDGRIHQFCIRSGDRPEFRFADAHTEMHKFSFDGLTETVARLARENAPVYFTIDLDCLDPSVFPGTGTPEAGGVSFTELLTAIIGVSRLRVVAADVNELAPMLDTSGASTAVACKTVRELLLSLCK